MTARDLAVPFPIVDRDTDALAAVRLLTGDGVPGLIVTGDGGRPWAVVPGSQVLRFMLPNYVQEDPGLARAYDETSLMDACSGLDRVPVKDLIDDQDGHDLPVVDAAASLVEVAAVMARLRSPLVAVVDEGETVGAIRLSDVLRQLVQP